MQNWRLAALSVGLNPLSGSSTAHACPIVACSAACTIAILLAHSGLLQEVTRRPEILITYCGRFSIFGVYRHFFTHGVQDLFADLTQCPVNTIRLFLACGMDTRTPRHAPQSFILKSIFEKRFQSVLRIIHLFIHKLLRLPSCCPVIR